MSRLRLRGLRRRERGQEPPLYASVAERLATSSPATYRYLLALFRLSEYVAAIEPDAIPVDWDAMMREAPMPGTAGGADARSPRW